MPQENNPLHGVKLEQILIELSERLGWERMAQHINIRCFSHDPSVKSSLKFLRKTPWAREKVEQFYVHCLKVNFDPNPPKKGRTGKPKSTPKSKASRSNSHIWGR